MKILIVDDNQYIIELINCMLKEEGFDLHSCSNVTDAQEALEKSDDFDLVITDIVMPEQDGATLARHVKEGDNPLPVLAITGGIENAVEDYVNYASMFADEVMAKPFKKEDLIATIKRLGA